MIAVEKNYRDVIERWWNARSRRARGNATGGLVLLENLRQNFNLDISAHKAEGSDQLKNATSSNVRKILERLGETRGISKEAGRTNRGMMKNMESLLSDLSNVGIAGISSKERATAFDVMQNFLTEKIREFINASKIRVDYRQGMISRKVIINILNAASERNKAGEVAEYLVGAKLALRFPESNVRNSSANAADDQTEDLGDFSINDCVFHVTISPNKGHYDKCKDNLKKGCRVFLLVPDNKLMSAREFVDNYLEGSIQVESIESFVSQNVEELSKFSGSKIGLLLANLFDIYNERVREVETDGALLIDIPEALRKKD